MNVSDHRSFSIAVFTSICSLLLACGSESNPDPSPQTEKADGGSDASLDLADLAPPDDAGQDAGVAACAPYAQAGPFAVGVRTVMMAGVPVEVWYPAPSEARDGEPDEYDIRTWLPEGERDKIPDEAPSEFGMDAFRDVDVEPGSYPLVLFSHGYGGYRLQSSALNVHVASWGYVVVSAEHPERGLMKIMSGDLNIMDRSAETLLELIEFLPEESWIAPHLRADSIAATGHSAGGGAALGVRDDPRIDAVITYGTSSLGSTSISKPSLFIGGTKDRLAGPNQLKSNFEAFPAPKRMTLIEGAGHLAFSDICLIGREEGGVLELASQYGIEVPPVLKILGTDGCKPDDLPAEEAWPQIHHLTVHHLRETWGDPVEAISEDGLRECFGPLLHAYLNEDTDS